MNQSNERWMLRDERIYEIDKISAAMFRWRLTPAGQAATQIHGHTVLLQDLLAHLAWRGEE